MVTLKKHNAVYKLSACIQALLVLLKKLAKTTFGVLVIVAVVASNAYSLSEWDEERSNGVVTYTPKDLSSKQTFYVRSYPPETEASVSHRRWFNKKVEAIQAGLGKPVKRLSYKKLSSTLLNKQGAYRTNAGEKLFASYMGGIFDNGAFYILLIVTSLDDETTDKYSDQYGYIIKRAKNDLQVRYQADSSTSSSSKKVAAAPQPSKPLSKLSSPNGLIGIWGYLSYGMQAGGVFGSSEDAIAVFKDGTLTTDIAGVFNLGIEQSKNQKPRRWGHWRKEGKALSIKWASGKKYSKHTHWWKNKTVGKDHRLKGCFTRRSSSSGGAGGIAGVTIGASRTWCFAKNGRFSNKKSSFGNAPNVSTSSTSATLGGRYRIDGHTMRLAYDSGKTITVGFAYMADKNNHIGINGVRYLGK